MNFLETTIDSWIQYVKLVSALPNFVYRGQSHRKWPLSTSIEREIAKRNMFIGAINSLERNMINSFQQRYHLYENSAPELDNKLEWCAIMQHFGAPTRLLDFSLSPYIALFFASSEAVTDFSVWCLNTPLLKKTLHQRHKKNLEIRYPHKMILDRDIRTHLQQANDHIAADFACASPGHLLCLESSRPNLRIVRQQGIFLAPTNFTHLNGASTFMDALHYSFLGSEVFQPQKTLPRYILQNKSIDSEIACLKINFTSDARPSIMKQLKQMGINHELLFPGLEGLAKSQLQDAIDTPIY